MSEGAKRSVNTSLWTSSSLTSTTNKLMTSSTLSNYPKTNMTDLCKIGSKRCHQSNVSFPNFLPTKQLLLTTSDAKDPLQSLKTPAITTNTILQSNISNPTTSSFDTSNKLLSKPFSHTTTFSSGFAKLSKNNILSSPSLSSNILSTKPYEGRNISTSAIRIGDAKLGSTLTTFQFPKHSKQFDVKIPTIKTGWSGTESFKSRHEEDKKDPEQHDVASFPSYDNFEDKYKDEIKPDAAFQQLQSMQLEKQENLKRGKEKLIKLSSIIAGPLAKELNEKYSETRLLLQELCSEVAATDPEFILKLALYCRQELNLRMVSNFLLAMCGHYSGTSYYLKKYYNSAIRIPSDWLDVANLSLTMSSPDLAPGSLPSSLRKVMKVKFADFDEYQLAKYNSDKSFAKIGDDLDEEERKIIIRSRDFTIKRLIRLLHISKPTQHVLSILGKKYPSDSEEFRQSGLDGVFNSQLAGQRMKLKTPETWETQVAIHGNKSSVWEGLIDNKKLPYMAMVRNLRNLLMTGISDDHIQKVFQYISNPTAVAKSRMFPFQFFTAYDVLKEVEKMKSELKNPKGARNKIAKSEKEKWMIKREEKQKKMSQAIKTSHINTLKKALDKAVNVSAIRNIPPLKGVTLIFCAYSLDMNEKFSASKGISQAGASVRDACLLFGVMCKQASEDGRLILYSSKAEEVSLASNDILSNVQSIQEEQNDKVGKYFIDLNETKSFGGFQILQEHLTKELWVDTVIILHAGSCPDIQQFLPNYRRDVNPDLVFACININQPASASIVNEHIEDQHPNDLYISGFSSSVFQFVVAHGNGGQLAEVEKIDRKHNLTTIPVPLKTSDLEQLGIDADVKIPKWQRAKVFISSTFLDMHGERDLLHQYVFPQLRKLARKNFVEVDFVDLRWGLTKGLADSNCQLEYCLKQIETSSIFVGLLGDRYGWIPDETQKILEDQKYDILSKSIKDQKVSITQIEMEYGALNCAEKVKDRAFFYIRDENFSQTLPSHVQKDFQTFDNELKQRMDSLKNRVRQSGLEVFSDYPADFGGIVGGKPIAAGLEEFGERILDNLWNAIQTLYPRQDMTEFDELSQEASAQLGFCKAIADEFVGREKALHTIKMALEGCTSGLVNLMGPPGAGSAGVLAKTCQQQLNLYKGSSKQLIIPFFYEGTISRSQSIKFMLRYFLHQIHHRMGSLPTFSGNWQSLCINFRLSIEKFCSTGGSLTFFVDGVEKLMGPHGNDKKVNTDWIPAEMPENAVIVLTSKSSSPFQTFLKSRTDVTPCKIQMLDLQDRMKLTRSYLSRQGKVLEETAFNNQLSCVITKTGAGSPSYLKLALGIISSFGLFEGLQSELEDLGSTSYFVLQRILGNAEDQLGKELVEQTMTLIYLSRYGLSPGQLNILLSFSNYCKSKESKVDLDTYDNYANSNIADTSHIVPEYNVYYLLNTLDNFFEERRFNIGGSLFLKQGDVHNVVFERYIKPTKQSDISSLHKTIASYFSSLYKESLAINSPNQLVLQGLPYHLGAADEYKLLHQILCTPEFIQQKCSVGLASDLYTDFLGLGLSSRMVKERFAKDPLVQEYKIFVKNHLLNLIKMPVLVPQLILNEFHDSPIRQAFLKNKQHKSDSIELMEWINGPSSRLEQDMLGYNIRDLATTYVTTIASYKNLLVSGLSDGAVVVSDSGSHQELFSLFGHSEEITAIDFVMGMSKLATASMDGWLSSWDLDKQIRLQSVKAHTRKVTGLASNNNGSIIVSVSWDGDIKVWNGLLEKTSTVDANNGPINCVKLHPRKLLAITGGWDKTIRIWDLELLKQKAVLRGHTSSIQDLKMSEDTRKIVSGSLDGTVKVWDSEIGSEVASFNTGDSCEVVELTDMDTKILTGGRSGMMTTWPLSRGKKLGSIAPASLKTKMNAAFDPVNGKQLDATSLQRIVSSLCFLDQFMILGFNNGDVQLINMAEAELKASTGWRVSNLSISLLRGRKGYDLASQRINWTSISDDDSMDLDDNSSIDDPLPFSNIMPDTNDFGNTYDVKDKSTIWIASGSKVLAGTIISSNDDQNGKLLYSVHLAGLQSKVSDILVSEYTTISEDLIIVGCGDGFLYAYNGHPINEMKKTPSIWPVFSIKAHNGGIVRILSARERMEIASKQKEDFNWDLITLGTDGILKAWSYTLGGETKISFKEIMVTQESFIAKPVGLEVSWLRERQYVFIAFADGTLAQQEIEHAGARMRFGYRKDWEGNGLGTLSMQTSGKGEHLMLHHTGGSVTLWSIRGAEICRYDQQSSSAFFLSGNSDLNGIPKVYLGREDIKFFSPFEAECLQSCSGHQGPITAIVSQHSEGNILTSGKAGQVRTWPSQTLQNDDWSQTNPGRIIDIRSLEERDGKKKFLIASSKGILTLWRWKEEFASIVASTQLDLPEGQIVMSISIQNIWNETILAVGMKDASIIFFLMDIDSYSLKCKEINKYQSHNVMNTLHTLHTYVESLGAKEPHFSLAYFTDTERYTFVFMKHMNKYQTCMKSTVTIKMSQDNELDKSDISDPLRTEGVIIQTLPRSFQLIYKMHDNRNNEINFHSEENGVLTVNSGTKCQKVKMHELAITAMADIGEDRLATASEDGTIKLWEFRKGNMEERKGDIVNGSEGLIGAQVGQFNGMGTPFTAMKEINGVIVAGDGAGNIFCLHPLMPKT